MVAKVKREEPIKEAKIIALPVSPVINNTKIKITEEMHPELKVLYGELNELLEQTRSHRGKQHYNLLLLKIEDKRKDIRDLARKKGINLRELFFNLRGGI
jgi:hemoglobin-like flavoprotein